MIDHTLGRVLDLFDLDIGTGPPLERREAQAEGAGKLGLDRSRPRRDFEHGPHTKRREVSGTTLNMMSHPLSVATRFPTCPGNPTEAVT